MTAASPPPSPARCQHDQPPPPPGRRSARDCRSAAGRSGGGCSQTAGHAYPPDGPLTVTFTGRARRTTIHPATVDGLWVAAVTGYYTGARCHTPAAASALQLMPVTPRPPPR